MVELPIPEKMASFGFCLDMMSFTTNEYDHWFAENGIKNPELIINNGNVSLRFTDEQSATLFKLRWL